MIQPKSSPKGIEERSKSSNTKTIIFPLISLVIVINWSALIEKRLLAIPCFPSGTDVSINVSTHAFANGFNALNTLDVAPTSILLIAM